MSDQFFNIVTSVYQPAVYRNTFAILNIITLNTAYPGQSSHNACPITVSESSFDVISVKILWIYVVIFFKFSA
ncbi:hypothetical protein SDC9_158784 [bioreactor metagenome]|uniref:Uncharacterized protein n=1 Tax=bioreactor metagenome TaxID=1076179 RepID=A0A645FAY8_9ZZZZ